MPSALPGGTDEIPDRERDEIRGHLRGGLECHGVLAGAGPGLIGNNGAVRDRVVVLVDRRGKLERRLQRRLVERREHPARVGGLELTHRVPAIVRLAEIQPPELIVQDALVLQVYLRLAGRDLTRQGERRLLPRRIERHLGGLAAATRDHADRVERDLGGIQRDRLRWPLQLHRDRARCRQRSRLRDSARVRCRSDSASRSPAAAVPAPAWSARARRSHSRRCEGRSLIVSAWDTRLRRV